MCINVLGLEFLEAVVPGAIKILCMHNIVPTKVKPIELECLLNCVEVLNQERGIEFTSTPLYR